MQCSSISRCQDFFSLSISHCQAIAQALKDDIAPKKPTSPPKPQEAAAAEAPMAPAASDIVPMDVLALNVKTLPKFDKIQWVSGGLGSTGVFFTTTSQGTFVAKPISMRTAGEVLASILAEKLGVDSAKMVVPSQAHQDQLLLKLRTAPAPQPTDRQRLGNERVAGVAIIEFVSALALPACAMVVLEGPHRQQLLHDIGRVMGLDMLLNNFDRLPLCWTNEGNPDNILVKNAQSAPHIVAIDSTLTRISHPEGRRRYEASVQSALEDLARGRGPALDRVKSSLINCTGFQMHDGDAVFVAKGVRSLIADLTRLQSECAGWAEAVVAAAAARCGDMGAMCGVADLDVNFLQTISEVVLRSDFAKS